MPVLTVHTRDGQQLSLPVSAAFSVLNTLLRNNVGIHHKCGGRALCGTCRIQILKGADAAPPPSEKELKRLQAIQAPDDYRLACQLFIHKDMTIRVPVDLPPEQEE